MILLTDRQRTLTNAFTNHPGLVRVGGNVSADEGGLAERDDRESGMPPKLNLSENQKMCLRLTAEGLSSKEVASRTGLAPQTVDTYLKQAMKHFGVRKRAVAAQMFVDQEAIPELVSPPPAVAGSGISAPSEVQGGSNWLRKLLVPIPPGGGLHDLGAIQKGLLAIRIGVTGVVMLLAILIVYLGLLTVF